MKLITFSKSNEILMEDMFCSISEAKISPAIHNYNFVSMSAKNAF